MNKNWWKDYFDEEYYRIYKPLLTHKKTARIEVEFIEKTLALKKDEHILDICCGDGRHLVILAKKGYRVIGIDYSEFILRVALKKAKGIRTNINLVRADMKNIPFVRYFDATYSFFTSFGYFSDKENLRTLKEINKALKPGGRFLIDVFNPLNVIKNIQKRTWFQPDPDTFVIEEIIIDPIKMMSRNKRYIVDKKGGFAEKEFIVRMYVYPEMVEMLQNAGFEYIDTFGSRQGEPYRTESKRMIILSKKI